MENYKALSQQYTQFIRTPKAFSSFLSLSCTHPSLSFKLKSHKSPLSLSALLKYYYTSTVFTAKLTSQDTYSYKFAHKGKTLPLNVFGKFQYQGQDFIKNSISVEYQNANCNLNLKITNHPMNLVFASTAGNGLYGAHSLVKSNLRLNRLQKCVIGVYYRSEELYGICKYNCMDDETCVFVQKNTDLGKICQAVQYNGKSKALVAMLGMVKESEVGTVGVRIDSRGQICMKVMKGVDENLHLEVVSSLDLEKSSRKWLVYTAGIRLRLNFNLGKE